MIIVFDNSSGRIEKLVSAPDDHLEFYGEYAFVSNEAISDATHYVRDGDLVLFPEKPSPHHEWDWPTKSWLPNLDAARNAKLQEVAAELSTRLYLLCNGFDADKVSRERISGMIARLQRGDGLPQGWIGWRDAQNQMHWQEETAAGVLHNLTSLARCIEDREQSLLVASWTHKENITKLQTIEEILQYDVTQNWPT